MTAIHFHRSRSRWRPLSRRAADRLAEAARRVLFILELWRERVRARNELARLDLRALRDIGLSPSERDFLVNKPFWRE